MKKIIFFSLLSLLFLGKDNAQCTGAGNGVPATDYIGFNYGTTLNFATNIAPQLSLLTTGDLTLVGPANSYEIAGLPIIWNNNNQSNLFVGIHAGTSTTGSNNTVVGNFALFTNTTSAGNTALGDSALYSLNGIVQTTANVAIGNSVLSADILGSGQGIYNTAMGEWAMRHNTFGQYNCAIGDEALYSNVTGNFNTANGSQALYSNGGSDNSAIGNQALYSNTTGLSNTALGNIAGYSSTTGSGNTFVGDSAGWGNGANSFNTFLGYNAGNGVSLSGVTNTTWIGATSGPAAPVSNYVYIGNGATTHISSAMAIITTWSDRRVKDDIQTNVPGLAFITRLTPVTYHYNLNKANQLLGVKNSSSGKAEVEQITQSGFIAQQVDSAAQACGYDFSGVVRPQTSNGPYALGYSVFVVPLVKAVQELNAKNNDLNTTIDSLRNAFQNIQSCLNQICAATGSNTSGNSAGNLGVQQNVTLSSTNSPLLYQNSPNPFSTGTKINYYLPEGTIGASMVFYDSYGNSIKTLQLSQTGNGTLNITADNLNNGIYSYSLIVNGNIIDTKRMVLQK